MDDVEERLAELEATQEPPVDPPIVPPIEPPVIPPPELPPTDGEVYEISPGRIDLAQYPPGSTILLRGGTYGDIIRSQLGSDVIMDLRSDLTVRAFPGEIATIDCTEAQRGVELARDLSDVLIADLELFGGQGFRAGGPGVRRNITIRNCVAHEMSARNSGAFGEFSSTLDLFILDNIIDNTQSGDPSEARGHTIYHGGRGMNRNVHISGNRITNNFNRRAIQIYGHQTGERMEDLFIEDNVIENYTGNAAILVSHSDGADKNWIRNALISNNDIKDGGGAGVHLICPDAIIDLKNNVTVNTQGLNIDERFGTFTVNDLGGNVWG